MTKVEKKIFDFLRKHILIIGLVAVTVLGMVLRFCGIKYQSGDYISFLQPWWHEIAQAGVDGLKTQVGNYNIPYQILICLFTQLGFAPLVSYKGLSIIFDFVLAISSALLVENFCEKRAQLKSFITYTLVFCSLPVILNSGFWAQCDSIYVSFILLAIVCIRKERHIASFVMLGIAFAFKLQFIFILPLFLFYYILSRKVSILHFLIIPAVNIVMCLPAIFMGRNFLDTFTIYFEQTDYGKLIQMNFPNLYAFMCDGANPENYYLLKTFSIVLTFIILGAALVLMIYKKVDISTVESFLLTSIWTVFTCVMFLSSMHERYSYLLDILLIIYMMVTLKRVWLAIACNLISLTGYCSYLFVYRPLDLSTTSIIYIAIYVYVTYIFAKEVVFASNNTDDKGEICEELIAEQQELQKVEDLPQSI